MSTFHPQTLSNGAVNCLAHLVLHHTTKRVKSTPRSGTEVSAIGAARMTTKLPITSHEMLTQSKPSLSYHCSKSHLHVFILAAKQTVTQLYR